MSKKHSHEIMPKLVNKLNFKNCFMYVSNIFTNLIHSA